MRAPLANCHSWLACTMWVCEFGLGFWLRPATPGLAVRCGCVCSGSGFGCAPPLLAGVCGVWVGCCLAPVCVPWFVACCAHSPGLWHPVAVAAWHPSVCLGCGRRRASLACLVAPHGAPRLVRSGRSRCSGWLSRRRGAFPHPGGLRSGFTGRLRGARGGWRRTGLFVPAAGKEGPYQDRPPLCPFRLLPLLIYSGSAIALFKFQGPKSKNIENVILLQP